jgi:hypothetical protein
MVKNYKNTLMSNFLNINFPIVKVKLKPKDLNFSRTLLVKSVFTGNHDKYYPINKNLPKELLLVDLITALKNVFPFSEEEVKVIALNYLKKLN